MIATGFHSMRSHRFQTDAHQGTIKSKWTDSGCPRTLQKQWFNHIKINKEASKDTGSEQPQYSTSKKMPTYKTTSV